MFDIDRCKLKASNLNGIYREIAEEFGIDVALKFYDQFKGLQITFPVRLLCKQYVTEQLRKEYNGRNLKELARKYSYSERWIRSIIYEDSIKYTSSLNNER